MQTNKVGRPFKFTANELRRLFEEYKEFVKTQFFRKTIYDQKISSAVTYDIQRPPTIIQFCQFVNIDRQTYYNLLNKDSEDIDNDLFDIITRVNDFIQDNQISGAILNEYNPTIVARLNGLNETVDINNTGTAPIINISLPSALKPLQRTAQDVDYTQVNNKSLNS